MKQMHKKKCLVRNSLDPIVHVAKAKAQTGMCLQYIPCFISLKTYNQEIFIY